MKKFFKILKYSIILLFGSSILAVAIYGIVPVYYTPRMAFDFLGNVFTGGDWKIHHKWVPIDNISPSLPRAVIASEDNRFISHHGFDFEQIRRAVEENKHRKRARGASTISQQTAKNVFLWSGHSYVRKGLEAYFTLLIEGFWSKRRIMEVYLNSIEMGENIYGAEAVAQCHFNKCAKELSRTECALIAATLPNPVRFNSAHPSRYIRKRKKQIQSLMNKIEPVNFNTVD